MTLNLYTDPGLTGNYTINGSAITASPGLIHLDGAGSIDIAVMGDGQNEADFFDRIAIGGQYKVSLHVSNATPGWIKAKIGSTGWTQIQVTGDGWTAPVTITAGTSRTVGFGVGGVNGTTLDIVPDANGEAIRITTG